MPPAKGSYTVPTIPGGTSIQQCEKNMVKSSASTNVPAARPGERGLAFKFSSAKATNRTAISMANLISLPSLWDWQGARRQVHALEPRRHLLNELVLHDLRVLLQSRPQCLEKAGRRRHAAHS